MTHRVFNDDCPQGCQCRVLEMPPERRSRRHKIPKGKRDCEAELANGSQEASRSVIVKDKSQKIPPPSQLRRSQSLESRVPEVFRSMLGALSVSPTESGPRRKRRKTHVETEVTPCGNAEQYARGSSCATVVEDTGEPLNDGEDYETPREFEDITGTKQMQIESSGSDDDSEQSEFEWEEVDIKTTIYKADEDKSHLELTLNRDRSDAHRMLKARRRKTITKADRILRLEVHKMHLLCLLAFFYRRNWWCNDEEIQRTLEPLITKKISACFNPPATYSSFGKAESIKKGLALCVEMWSSKFQVTEKGMRRSFWVEEVQLSNIEPPADLDPVHNKDDFRAAARKLAGSRDVGAQLFCALLRRTGLDVRLVFSLQPVSFSLSIASGTSISAPGNSKDTLAGPSTVKKDAFQGGESLHKGGQPAFKPLRWLSNINAANYSKDQMGEPSHHPLSPKKRISESPYPIFWVEVLDTAHLKWLPVNPFDATALNKPKSFEPPASDPENNLSYVVAFEDDGIAKDVTRRYANAFNSKTRKNRVESLGGEIWWRKRMEFYSRFQTRIEEEIDALENIQLADIEAREPMPRNIADFKSHPTFVLERNLRKNEVLVDRATIVGTIAMGKDARGRKMLENVYRRRDVRTVKSADKWFHVGRQVKDGEQPRKLVMRKNRGERDKDNDVGTGLYDIQQTEVYEAPPVVNGRMPKNSYGNLDIYVPSMIPPGACHITDELAKAAAQIIGVDYAQAVTDFSFKGRRGMPVITGVVVAAEYREAIEAVMEILHDEEQQAEHDRRSRVSLQTWKRFLVALRIARHVDGYREGEEELPAAREPETTENLAQDGEDDEIAESEEYFDDGDGGFFR